ncbi:MAG TPA: translation factor GTPase family protein [Candidatus Dormibacteraeota bacterium]|nr:translation factor GTPase family protein [Candidatus Dormibacteraeota bacterium]
MGIVAHVDAGKTTLTERLLFRAGVIPEMGSVDRGTTRTDSMELERSRGITIRSAVASFLVHGLKVNLIDTPGHPDFIAEVDRALGVLDAAVLVISAVEGIQSQTRVLMRALSAVRLPTLLFVNKIDRSEARPAGVLEDIRRRLAVAAVPLDAVEEPGTRRASVRRIGLSEAGALAALAEHDEGLLGTYVDGAPMPEAELRGRLREQTARTTAYPVCFGSAVTGAGVEELLDGISDLLPPARGSAVEPLDGTVFKVERGASGERVAYVRLHAGRLRIRERVSVGGQTAGGSHPPRSTITAIRVFGEGTTAPASDVEAGDIAQVWGLARARIGDRLGHHAMAPPGRHFAAPALETVVRPVRSEQARGLHDALRDMADQDPFINVRQDAGELSVSLYGEVQKEVIGQRLLPESGIAATFEPTLPVLVERPLGVGEAREGMSPTFVAEIGLRVEPGGRGGRVLYRLETERGALPRAFHTAIEETVVSTLGQGLLGWEVIDCTVTLTRSGYSSPVSTAADFRGLTPLVLMAALRQARTRLQEPFDRFELEIPRDALGEVMRALEEIGASTWESGAAAGAVNLEGEIPTGGVHQLQSRLPSLTGGAGALASRFAGYRPLIGPPRLRARRDGNPLNRQEYLLHLRGRA